MESMVKMGVKRLESEVKGQETGFNHILKQSWRFEKEHRVSDWHGTPFGKHGCHYTALCVTYAECAIGRGGEGDERYR